MEETKYFLVLTETELVLLDTSLEGLVDIALEEQNRQQAKALLGIQLQCRNKRQVKAPAKSWTTLAKEQWTGKSPGGK